MKSAWGERKGNIYIIIGKRKVTLNRVYHGLSTGLLMKERGIPPAKGQHPEWAKNAAFGLFLRNRGVEEQSLFIQQAGEPLV